MWGGSCRGQPGYSPTPLADLAGPVPAQVARALYKAVRSTDDADSSCVVVAALATTTPALQHSLPQAAPAVNGA